MKPALIWLACVLLVVLAISYNQHRRPGEYAHTDGIILDADVPGTHAFLAEKDLGRVPVTLSARKLARLGIPNPRKDTNAVLFTTGNSAWVCRKGLNPETRFMFQVPPRVRSKYLSMETPWGMRTKFGQCSFGPGGYWGGSCRVQCLKVPRDDGLSLRLEALPKGVGSFTPLKLKVTLSNHGPRTIKGFRPSIQVWRASFGSPWVSQGAGKINLPKEWASIKPHQSLETEISSTPPDDKADYGFCAIFQLFKDQTSDHLAGDGWCYSNTRLFSVR
jgi:hypothetical protein